MLKLPKVYDEDRGFSFGAAAGYAVGAVVALTTLANTVFFIGETDRGLLYTAGALQTESADQLLRPGVHVKIPFIQGVRTFPSRFVEVKIDDLQTYTRDNQVITGAISLNVRIPEAQMVAIARNHPDWESKIQSAITDSFKAAMGSRDAETIAANRAEIVTSINNDISTKLVRLYGIESQAVQLTNFDFTEAFEARVEQAAGAKAEQTQRQTEQETARITAETARITAQGAADAERTRAEGEAAANDLIGASLARNPRALDQRAIDAWARGGSRVPEIVVGANGGGNGSVPFIINRGPAAAPGGQ